MDAQLSLIMANMAQVWSISTISGISRMWILGDELCCDYCHLVCGLG